MTNRFGTICDRILITLVIILYVYGFYMLGISFFEEKKVSYVKHKSGNVGVVINKNRHSYHVKYGQNGKIMNEVWMNRDITF